MTSLNKYKKVDLLGFSLGTQVIKSWLATLKELNVLSIINNVYFMGGATWLNSDDADIFDWVSTSINHCYTKRDHTLMLYKYHQIYFGKKEFKKSNSEDKKEGEGEEEKVPEVRHVEGESSSE